MSVSGRVGVREVARRAGVSTQTVSRVINEAGNVRPETRTRVLAAMAELGFSVNNAARALGTRMSRTIGVVASDATLYGPTLAISALEAAARERDRWISTAFVDGRESGSADAAAGWLVSQGVDGLVVVGPRVPLVTDPPDVPVVVMHTGDGATAQRRGATLAVRHLLDLGHRRLVRLGGPADWAEESARNRGYQSAVRGHGVETILRWRGDWSAGAGFSATPDVIEAMDRGTTAVVVANDQMALGLIAGLAERGKAVPRDVSVVGFDDNPDAAYYLPALTTVSADIAGEARRCIGAAMGDSSAYVSRAPRLIVRSSTAQV
jgi:DNA-binding LacI/PurR family transcriptional regulator